MGGLIVGALLLFLVGCGTVSSLPSPLVETATPRAAHPATTPALRTAAAPGVVFEGGTAGALWELADFRHELLPDRVRLTWQVKGGLSVPGYTLRAVSNEADPHPTNPGPFWGQVRVDLIFFDVYARAFPLQQRFPVEAFDTTSPVVRVGLYPTFDDTAVGFSVGLRQRVPLEVYELVTPSRLVVDVLRAP
ncbi:MAG: hypothetical protein Q9O62_06685 [Ardenticatenia bacterium]|nr:hypothetical protein [Ardenticatenia bacterium]